MKTFYILFLALLVSTINADNQYGYISYSGVNIGDDIQSIAAKSFLPDGSLPIDREFIGQNNRLLPLHTIVNGWYMYTKKAWYKRRAAPPENSWPPAPYIDPLLISIHLTKDFLPEAFSTEGIEYLKQHGPVGARDFFTLEELHKRDIPCYFSGCLTLTLKNSCESRGNTIYAVDVPDSVVDYIKANTAYNVVRVTHFLRNGERMTAAARLRYAEEILEKYRNAACVVTSRLHAAMPCLAFETPVLLINTQDDQYRFSGLKELVRNCSISEVLEGKSGFDFNQPTENPKDYLPIRENLISIVSKWVKERADY